MVDDLLALVSHHLSCQPSMPFISSKAAVQAQAVSLWIAKPQACLTPEIGEQPQQGSEPTAQVSILVSGCSDNGSKTLIT